VGVPSLVDTSGRAFAPAMAARPLLVKPNAREAAAFVGRPVVTPEEALQAGRQLRAAGAEMALITLGAAGAVFVHELGAWFVQAERVERPLSTVGCGDAFNGGLLAELHAAVVDGAAPTISVTAQDEAVLMRGLRLGAACAAANTLMLGAGRMDQADVQRFRQGVTIQRLA
jgi:fructose-1-phosphate kinase PfkB-like protein